jgi:hypothetical protein
MFITFVKENKGATCVLDITGGSPFAESRKFLLLFQQILPAVVEIFRTKVVYLES